METTTIEEKLKDLILHKYKSVLEFSNNVDVPYTTIKSMLTRGIGNTSVNNVIKVCKALNISVDALANGEIETRYEFNTAHSHDVQDIVDDVKAKLSYSNHLTINGKEVDIEIVEPIIEGLDIGFEMVKRKTKLE